MTSKPAQAVQVSLPLNGGNIPMPADAMGLSQWIGIKCHKMWWFVMQRKQMYKIHHIPKKKGGVRILHEPMPKMKYAQRMLLDRVLDKFPVQPHFGAYTGARGVRYTAARHAGHKIVLELDIKDFFGSTTRKYVREFFRAAGWPAQPANLAADLLTYPVKKDLSIVPQGAPSSPQLCNLIGHMRFDQKILAAIAAIDPGWVYTRYSDNIVLSHPEDRPRPEVNDVLNAARSAITSGGYRVHPKKIKIMRSSHPKKPQRLLGLTINTTPNVPAEDFKRLRAQVHRACTKGLDQVTGIPKGKHVASHLKGRLAYYLHINPGSQKILALKNRLEAAEAKTAGAPVIWTSSPPLPSAVDSQ
jgi:hypothetical protein